MQKFSRFLVLGIAVLSMTFVLQAQDLTLEEVAANSADYYGQELTLEGTIENFLSPHVFIVGEDALIDNDQVLAINRSGQVLPLNVMEGSYIVVTGTIYPSLNEVENGAVLDGLFIDPEVGNNDYYGSLNLMDNTGEVMEATEDPMNMMTDWGSFNLDTTSYFYNGRLARDYDDHTVLVIDSVNAVSVINNEE